MKNLAEGTSILRSEIAQASEMSTTANQQFKRPHCPEGHHRNKALILANHSDPLTFFEPLFDGRNIIPNGNTNYALVGITQAQCKADKVSGNCTNVPSVNSQLDKCNPLIGQPRLTCYENLDKYLMTNVVPWVPYMWSYVTRITSKNVTKYAFDQFATTPAYAHIAVK